MKIFYLLFISLLFHFNSFGQYDDPEDNCCINNAIPMAENETKFGNVGKYNTVTNDYEDEFDTYRIILPKDGAITLIVKSRLDQCGIGDEDYEFWLAVTNRNDNNLEYATIFYHSSFTSGPPPCNTFRYDTIKLRAFAADTFYLSLNAYADFSNAQTSYEIKYQMVDVTEIGDAEPNNTEATALPISEGETKKGHVQFKKAFPPDNTDYYKAVLPQSSNLRVYLKVTSRERVKGSTSPIIFSVPAIGFTRTRNVTAGNDGVYLDTFNICGADIGNVYFQLSGSPFEYEFRYEIISTLISYDDDPEPNNTIAQALPIAMGETKQGRINYKSTPSSENLDYYKTYLPRNGTMRIFVQTTNYNCINPVNPPTIAGYSKQSNNAQVFSRSLPIPAGQTRYDTIYTCAKAADSFYFRFQGISSTSLRYQFRYEMFDVDTTNDFEPDNSFEEARFIGQGQGRDGFVGLKYNNVADVYDYNKIAISSAGKLTIYFKAQSIGCIDNRVFGIWGYRNKVNSYVFLKRYVLNAVGTIDAGQIVQDTIEYDVPSTTDTIFLRIEGNGAFKYEFAIKEMAPTSSFTLVGDTAACIGPAYTYKAVNVINANNITYNWSLPLGGGTLTFQDSTATVFWNQNANRKIQLFLSNQYGTSRTKQLNVVINGVAPTQVPVAYNFARMLSTNSIPPGGGTQWFKDGVAIPGATDSTYYAADAGSFTVKFTNDCGPGSPSNAIVFPAAAQPQTITFPHIGPVTLTPTSKVKLNATASSGLPVFYQKISGPGTIVNDTLTITGAGTIIVKATQPGDDIYSPAAAIFDTIIVVKGNQVITFDSIPNQLYNTTDLLLPGSSSSGLTISYTIIAGSDIASLNNLSGSGTSLNKLGVGTVTLRATQSGNAHYNAAAPVERTFCIGVRTLTNIVGVDRPCLATFRYTTQKIKGANYFWTLSGGGILTTINDTAIVQWQTPGTYTLRVKANSPCDPVFTNEVEYTITTSGEPAGPVSGMLPANGAIDQQLPLKLSWIPAGNTVTYDLYVWDSESAQPATPYAANLTTVTYTLPKNSLPYNKTYNWKVIAKNPCSQADGPIQQFRLIPLADLVVSEVHAPASSNSGQTITISWKITNAGPGRTLTNQSWKDAVFFSFDTIPNFKAGIDWDKDSWSSLTNNRRPLLLGTKANVSALDVGQSYTNSINFTLPINYSQPLYVYVITNYPAGNNAPLQVTVLNDTLRVKDPINITLSPTPDLRVDSVFTPTSTFSGSEINVSYRVKNYGVVTPAGAKWSDAVYISQNPLFDKTNAIRLKSPKPNGSYYPNANDASYHNETQLKPDSVLSRSLSVIIPNYIFGTWFIYVEANSGGALYEGALNNNNINHSQVQVFLTPTPKLTVSTLNVPVTSASTTQPIGVNWNIYNDGFRDNIEKARGHFLTIGACFINCGYQRICSHPVVKKDSVVFGSSYWLDRVYLSTDPNGLNINNATLIKETAHGTQYSGVYLDQDYIKPCGVGTYFAPRINVDNIIDPGSNFAKSENFRIPSDFVPGNYYVYVITNATKTVYEYPGTPQIKRSDLPINIQRPDITVSAISVPANVSGGVPFNINYNLLNIGQGSVFNHVRRDRIYMSNFSIFDGSAQLIATKTFTNDLPAGTPVPHTVSYTLPEATSGAKYFYVLTNYDSAFKETNSGNNLSISAGTMVSAAMPNDLIVTSVQLEDTVFTIFPTYIKYTVPNNGTGSTLGSWTDSLFISCSPAFNRATSFFVAKRPHSEVVEPGGSYTDSFYFTIPKMAYEINSCFPQTPITTAYFFIKTNADSMVYEGTNINNNMTGTGSRVLVNALVDRIVTRVTGPDTVIVARPNLISWTVKNIGYDPGRLYNGSHSGYSDAVYFSPDSVFNSKAVLANSFLKYTSIIRNDTLRDSKSVITPNIPAGDYYVFVKTNSNHSIQGEIVLDNNTNLIRDAAGAAKKIHVLQTLLPDLTDSIISAPDSVAVGQPITVIHRVTNKGVGVTYPASWYHLLRLSVDFIAVNNDGDKYLNQKNRKTALLPGESYLDTITVNIPSNTPPGNYVLISEANSSYGVFESNTNNNLAFSLLTVYVPPAADLIVENISKPDTVLLGYTIDTARWIIKNASANEAKGISTDGIYLTKSEIFDSTATLVGIKSKKINMAPLALDTVKLAAFVNNVTEGNYYVFVKTDLLNNITETDKNNNTGMAPTPIYVKVKELPLNVLEANTLHHTSRYYKLLIPDSLIGATIRVTLKTKDSLLVRNEMFMGGGYIPSAARYDYKFEIPNYGNQQIVMSSVTDSVYYIVVSCVSPNPPVQNITLKAERLPFAILNVHTNSGGNIGNVTVKLSGSLFRDSMTAKLNKPGTEIIASAVYFINSTTAYATFNLQGQPLGVYDISLMKPDSATATLANGFSVVPANNGGLITGGGVNKGSGKGNEPGCDPGAESGLNSQLVVEMVVPARAILRQTVLLQINYRNPTNFDIPAQTRTLFTEAGMKLAFTRAGVPTGTTALYLELTEPGGPPGIIRAGGSGTITVYTTAPSVMPRNPVVLFKLK